MMISQLEKKTRSPSDSGKVFVRKKSLGDKKDFFKFFNLRMRSCFLTQPTRSFNSKNTHTFLAVSKQRPTSEPLYNLTMTKKVLGKSLKVKNNFVPLFSGKMHECSVKM
jgi:hypothetical protein